MSENIITIEVIQRIRDQLEINIRNAKRKETFINMSQLISSFKLLGANELDIETLQIKYDTVFKDNNQGVYSNDDEFRVQARFFVKKTDEMLRELIKMAS